MRLLLNWGNLIFFAKKYDRSRLGSRSIHDINLTEIKYSTHDSERVHHRVFYFQNIFQIIIQIIIHKIYRNISRNISEKYLSFLQKLTMDISQIKTIVVYLQCEQEPPIMVTISPSQVIVLVGNDLKTKYYEGLQQQRD